MRGAVLAGGRASRFGGRPKGLERVGGERVLDRVVRAVAEATGAAPLLVANAGDAAAWCPDLEVVTDVVPGCGALGGIYTAVTHAPEPVLVVAWDLPFVTAAFLECLVRGAGPYDAYLAESGGPRGVEPLCAVYRDACGPWIREALDRGDYRAVAFHEHVRVGTLPLETVRRFDAPERLFFNVNSAEDLARAEAMWRAPG